MVFGTDSGSCCGFSVMAVTRRYGRMPGSTGRIRRGTGCKWVHRAGGAPYELQLGDGVQSLWYALHTTYHGSLYGLAPDAATASSTRIHRAMDTDLQQQARRARLRSGIWALPAAYLRQARTAAHLQTVGQQRVGGQTLHMLSFSGFSPLGWPPDATERQQSRVTMLLAFDVADGRLQSVIELPEPVSDQPDSHVTWRLRGETWLNDSEQARAVFDIQQVWTGKGSFPLEPHGSSIDPTFLLVEPAALVHPVDLPSDVLAQLWIAAPPPPDTERALLRHSTLDLTYVGHERWLTLTPADAAHTLPSDFVDHVTVGPWSVGLRAGRGQHYALALVQDDANDSPAATLKLTARGYTRAELLAVIERLRRFDKNYLQDYAYLFRP